MTRAVQRCVRVNGMTSNWETVDLELSDDATELWHHRFHNSHALIHLQELAAQLWYLAEEKAGRGWNTLERPHPYVADSEPWTSRARAVITELMLHGLIEPVRFRPDAFKRIDGSHVP